MKKTFQAAALIILSASTIIAAVTSHPPQVKNYWPEEWGRAWEQPVPGSKNEATVSSKHFINNNKNK